MIAYAYSFLHYQGPVWAKQPDILRYLETCVERFGLREHLQRDRGHLVGVRRGGRRMDGAHERRADV